MAKIVFSMSGEGRGHAARVRALVERLRFRHEITLLAPGQAYDFLQASYGRDAPTVRLERIPGLRFHYTRGQMNLWKSTQSAASYLAKLPTNTARVQRLLDHIEPDLAVCDFEPILPRVAKRCGLPLLAVNHQHFALAYDLSSLPRALRFYAWGIAQVARAHHQNQCLTVVSAFFRPPLRPAWRNAIQVGPLLRPEIHRQRPSDEGFVLSYLRPFTPKHVVESLTRINREVRVYGLGEQPPVGQFRFMAIDQDTYSKDLAACSAYVGAAGNQTLGELLFYGKPVLALPESKHHEQRINAHFIRQMGVGDFQLLEKTQDSDLISFFANLDRYREQLTPYRGKLDGTGTTLKVIKHYLPRQSTAPMEMRTNQRTVATSG